MKIGLCLARWSTGTNEATTVVTDAYPIDAHSKRYELLEHSQTESSPIKDTDASYYYWKDSQRVTHSNQVFLSFGLLWMFRS